MRTRNNRRGEGIVLGNLARLRAEQGRVDETRSLYRQCVEIAREVGDRRVEGITLTYWAPLERRQGALEEARDLLEAADAILREVGDMLYHAVCVCEQGHLALARTRSATRHLEEARAVAEKLKAGPDSMLGQSIARLSRAVDSLEPLHYGECPQDVPR
jgi:hypothetical protein